MWYDRKSLQREEDMVKTHRLSDELVYPYRENYPVNILQLLTSERNRSPALHGIKPAYHGFHIICSI